MTTIQFRIDEKTKVEVKEVLDELGMDMSSAIKYYLQQVIIRKGIPFELLTKNGLTVRQENAILSAEKEADKGLNVKRTKNKKEVKKYLDELK